MNGAVSSQIRAHTTHENIQIFCLVVGTSSLVHVNKTACEQVVAIFEIIANVIPNVTYEVSETDLVCAIQMKRKKNKNKQWTVNETENSAFRVIAVD